jgi:osmotically inducible protein OsmC
MAFSKGLADAGFTPTSVETVAKVHLDKGDAGLRHPHRARDGRRRARHRAKARFQKIAEGAKENCPISQAALSRSADSP